MNHLEDSNASPETTPAQQSVLDAHIRAKIQAEISRLRAEEEDVKRQLELALQRENIERERGDRDFEDGQGDEEVAQVKSTSSLQSDLEEIQQKVNRFHRRQNLEDVPEVHEAKERVTQCYACVLFQDILV